MSPANRTTNEPGRRARLGRGVVLASVMALPAAWVVPADSLAQTFTITAGAGAGGSVTPSGPVVVASGADQAFSIAPDACFTILDVLVDGASVGSPTTYTFSNVTADHSIAASFTLQSPTVSVASDMTPSVWGQTVTLTATVLPAAATGSITFKDSLTTLGTVALSGGTAQLAKSNLFPGNHTQITAAYSGDACYAPKTSAPYSQPVYRATPVVNLTSDVDPSAFGQNVVLTSTLAPAGGTGRVTFYDGVASIGTATVSAVTGIATLNVGNFVPGVHHLTASYPGDAHFEPGTSSTYDQVVDPQPTSVDLVSDANPTACQQVVTLTATVTPGDATGSVTFRDGAAAIGTASIDAGVATLALSTLAVGGHSLTAAYEGDALRAASVSSPISQTVGLAIPALVVTSDTNPSVWGQEVAIYATVTPASAAGTITFKDSLTTLGTASLAGGIAEIFKFDWYTGNHTAITAVYSGDACFGTATSAPYAQLVHRAPSTVSVVSDLNPSSAGDNIHLWATVSPLGATGRVTFYVSGSPIGTAAVNPLNGLAMLSLDNLIPGSHTVTASYPGDSRCESSTSAALTQVVSAQSSSTTLSLAPDPSACAEPVTLTATVTPSDANGSVDFSDGGTPLGSAPVVSGVATLAVSTLAVGTHSIGASYSGDGFHSGSSAPAQSLTVTQATPGVSVTSDVAPSTWGQAVTLTATMAPASATGTITFKDSLATLGTVALSGGVAQLVKSNLNPGNHTAITAVYSGDACFAGATSAPHSQLVGRAPTTAELTTDVNPTMFGQTARLTVSVTPAGATGRVTFYDAGSPIGTASVNAAGTATLNVSNLVPGTHALRGDYPGDLRYQPSSAAPYDQVVTTMTSSVVMTSDVNPSESGQQVTLTATVTPSDASGTVTFYTEAIPLGGGVVNSGVATFSISGLSIATHMLTAHYSGCTLYNASASATYAQDVVVSLPPAVDVTWPNGGENLDVGSNVTLTWTAVDNPPVVSVTLDVSLDNGANWSRVATDIANSGSYVWTVPAPGTNTSTTPVYSALFRVAATDGFGVTGYDQSNAPFSVFDTQVPVIVTPLGAETRDDGILVRWSIADRNQFTRLELERSPAEVGPWTLQAAEVRDDLGITSALDRSVEIGKTYYYRLLGTTGSGAQSAFGLVKATAWAPREFALSAAWPNPTRGPLTLQFTVPRDAHVKLSVLDLQGREVAPLTEGNYPAGRFQVDWDGRSDRGIVPTGLYFLQLVTPEKRVIRRVAITR